MSIYRLCVATNRILSYSYCESNCNTWFERCDRVKCCRADRLFGRHVNRCCRIVRVHPSLFPPGASPARLHSFHLSAEHAGSAAVVGVILDRPGVGASSHLSRHPHDVDDHDAELGPGQISGRIFHEGDRRLDGHLSGLCVRRFHRVFDR